MKIVYFFTVFLFSIFTLSAQWSITLENNLPRHGDRLIKMRTDWVAPGACGDTLVWDFRGLQGKVNPYLVTFEVTGKGDSTTIVKEEHRTRYVYGLRGDSVFIRRHENRLVYMNYSPAGLLDRFPFFYGDSLTGEYRATGEYCGEVKLRTHGSVKSVADGAGRILLPGHGDSLQSIRVRSVSDYWDIGRDSARIFLTQYRWYVRGYRYPVIEMSETKVKRGNEVTDHFKTGFYYAPAEQEASLAGDSANEEVLALIAAEAEAAAGDSLPPNGTTNPPEQGLEREPANHEYCSFLKLYPIPVKSLLHVGYTLKKEANVVVNLYEGGFRLMRSVALGQRAEGEHLDGFDLTGIPRGEYHLHICFDSAILKEIILKVD